MISATLLAAVALAAPAAPTVTGPRQTLNHSATYTFQSSGALSYRCAVDSPRLHRCSAQPIIPLSLGSHVLRVQAVGRKKQLSPVRVVRVTVDPPAPLLQTKALWRSHVFTDSEGYDAGSQMTVAGNRLYAPDPDANRMVVYDLDGNVVQTYGSTGSAPGQFVFRPLPQEPAGLGLGAVGVDPGTGAVFVADPGNYRVEKFDAAGTFLKQWGGLGAGHGQFTRIIGVTVANSQVYAVEDRPLHFGRVQVFDLNGNYQRTFGYGQITDSGGGLVVAPNGNVILSDDDANDLKVYSPSGKLLRTIGEYGTLQGQLNFPTDLALSGTTLWVADTRQGRVDRFDITTGRPTGTFPLADVSGVAVDSAGHVYTIDGQENLTKWEVTG